MLETFVLQDSGLMQPAFIHRPEQPNGVAVVIVNALHWDSVGPGRSMYEICNRLAACGIAAVRYEPAYDWIGSFNNEAIDWQEAVFRSLQQVIAFIQNHLGIKRIHVMGYCLGAQFAFLNTAVHPSIASLILVEIDIGMVVTAPNLLCHQNSAIPPSIRRDRKKRIGIYLRKLLLPETWAKAILLRIDWKGISDYLFERADRFQNSAGPQKSESGSADSEVEKVSEIVRKHVGSCQTPILYFHNPFAAHEDKVQRMHTIIFSDCNVTYVDCTTIWGSIRWVDEISPRIIDWCKAE